MKSVKVVHKRQAKSLVLPVLLQSVAASINNVASINSINDSVLILDINQYQYQNQYQPPPFMGRVDSGYLILVFDTDIRYRRFW
ncbi:MAG: hypothetical protein DDT29_02338 [Dehalococcoidia bacterium]|nr:hypothetical protein [Bacillota bacterium]